MSREIVYRGRKIQVACETVEGRHGQIITRDIILHPGAVAILPIVSRDEVCLLRNERPNAGEVLWEIPAGTLEPGEPPDQAAVRELAEETGFRAARWTRILEAFPSPGVLSERMWLYVAENLTPGPQKLEADENLEPHLVPWTQALAWITDGTLRDMKTILALLLWDRMRPNFI